MKKALCVLTLLACVASANAYVELYLVPDNGTHGIQGDLRWNTNAVNFLPQFAGVATGGLVTIDTKDAPAPLQTYFMYAQFVNEDPYCKLYGLNVAANWDAGVNVGQNLMYRQNKTNPPPRWKRWDGDLGIALVNGVAVAVTADGIQFYQPGDGGNADLYEESVGIALIGAVEVGANQATLGDFRLGMGEQGLVINDTIHQDPTKTYFPEVRFNGTIVQGEQYTEAGKPAVFGVAPGIHYTPEPASLLLLGLAGLLIRRR
jgi:hypothetical protein